MNKPILVIMAAGMGSRYGGLKQIDPIDHDGHVIVDFSIYDAVKAGFEKVVFIIKKENEKDFREALTDRLEKFINVEFAFQCIEDLPKGYSVPEGRKKPWGTAHAIYACRNIIKGPFAVINADDFYGREAFKLIYSYLSSHEDDELFRYTMVSYELSKTVTDNGYVSRGVCSVDEDGKLLKVTERTRIEKREGEIAYTEDDGENWTVLPKDTKVSMNMWGFTRSIIPEIEKGFPAFLDKAIKENPLKGEYFLPSVVSGLLNDKKAEVKVLNSHDRWYGVTYKEDKESVVSAIEKMKEDGLYPKKLWEED